MMTVLEFQLLKCVFIRLYVQLTSHSFSSQAASLLRLLFWARWLEKQNLFHEDS